MAIIDTQGNDAWIFQNNPADDANTPDAEDPDDGRTHQTHQTHPARFDYPRLAETPPTAAPARPVFQSPQEPHRLDLRRLTPATRSRDRELLESI